MPTGGTVNWEDFITTPAVDYATALNDYRNTVTTNAYTVTLEPDRTYTAAHIVSSEELDAFAHRLYKIIEDHTPIDISEEEFMELIMDDR